MREELHKAVSVVRAVLSKQKSDSSSHDVIPHELPFDGSAPRQTEEV